MKQQAADLITELKARGYDLPEDFIERIDGLYLKGFKDGLERGMYEQMTMEDAECVQSKS